MELQAPAEDAAGSIRAWLSESSRGTAALWGTVHRRDEGGLRLLSAANTPEKVQATVAWAPSEEEWRVSRSRRADRDLESEGRQLGRGEPGAKAVDARISFDAAARGRGSR